MKNIKPLILIALMLMFFSCAGFRPGVSRNDALDVIEIINSGETEQLIESSSLPFVFDSEILESETLVRALWSGLARAGYVIDNPVIVQQRPVEPGDGQIFSESWEVSTFFRKLLSEDDVFVEAESSTQRVYMVLRSGKKGVTEIKAWKGETK